MLCFQAPLAFSGSHRSVLAAVTTLAAGLVAVTPVWAQSSAAPVSHAEPPVLEQVVLGSGGPGATGRAGASHAILLDGRPRILVDAGPGAFVRAGEAKLNLAELDTVLLTHLHVDHAGGLSGLVKARAVGTRGAITFKVFGPDGVKATGKGSDAFASFPSTKRYIDLLFGANNTFGYLKDFAAPITFKVSNLRANPKTQNMPMTIVKKDGLTISAIAGHHRDAPAVIYRVDYKGKSITFSGDIDPAGHANLRRIARGSNLLVFNSVVLDPPGSPEILYTLHTAPQDIGWIAKDVAPDKLLLSHLSPYLDRAQDAVTASISQNYRGPIEFAQDGMRLVP
jgi:ribonuclease BN (tRNA processing enzyme)